MKDLFFVTSNDNKVREVEAILNMKIQKADIDLAEIQSLDVEDVVKDKAVRAYEKIKKPLFVEDTGIYIQSLNNFPGALAKWIGKSLGFGWLCKVIEGDRRAQAKTCVCLYDGKDICVFSGAIDGEISREVRGENGFGWDKIFIPRGYDKTFAEMGTDEKNTISMRKIAFVKMKEFLEK